jgi:hypothetical protein
MDMVFRHPLALFVISLVALWFSARIGAALRNLRKLEEEEREDFAVVVSATLTLLALIIGFSFSMAISRYDQRKNYEEAEANAIGTEYVCANLQPAADAAKVRGLLRSYLDQRISFYRSRDAGELSQIDATTGQLQNDLWSAVQTPSLANPTPVAALVVSGMNDVLNSQGYTQAAWWNRIPDAAWALMAAIALGSNMLIGYVRRRADAKAIQFFVLPLVVSISFFLIADVDAPRAGGILVSPQNLEVLAHSMSAH